MSSSAAISPGNSSTTLLGSNATFTGAGEDVLNYSGVRVYARQSGGKSAVFGLKIQWSHDGITWRTVEADQFTVQDSRVMSVIRPIRARFMRINYTNGPSAQAGFQLQTILVSGADNTNTIEVEGRILHAQERSGRVGVTGSVGQTNVDTTLITVSGSTSRVYIKTIVYSAFNRDADSEADFRIRDNVVDKIPFLVPRQALPASVPSIDGVIDFGDTPMSFNTNVRLVFNTNPAGLAKASIAVHGYEEFIL